MKHSYCHDGISYVFCVMLLLSMGQLPSILATVVADTDACAVGLEARSDCGYLGIQQAECEAQGCCWSPVPTSQASPAAQNDAPWCYHPAAPATNYLVTDISAEGAATTLQLNLSSPQLQQYGPDLQQLTMLVEQQTPQRLHIKILPADTARWEIPESLIPRPPSGNVDPYQEYTVQLPDVGQPFSFSVIRQSPPAFKGMIATGASTMAPSGEGSVQMMQPGGASAAQDLAAGPRSAGWLPSVAHKLMAALSAPQQQALRDWVHAAWQRLVQLSHRGAAIQRSRSGLIGRRQWDMPGVAEIIPRTQQQAAITARDVDPEQLLFSSDYLVYKEQYLELSTALLEGASLYGLGETVQGEGLQLKRDGRVVTLWATDIGSNNPDTGLYGAHPFYLQVQPSGASHGVLLLNSNGMDITLQPEQLTYRVIGGVLDLYFFMGPSPEEVIRQYQEVIGRPAMPPWWALGFHQCRWGYLDLEEVAGVVAGYQEAGIPLDTIWTDIDYMSQYRDFTFDPVKYEPQAFKAFGDRLHSQELHWVPIIDCGIPQDPSDPAYVEGLAADVFIKDRTGQPYLGVVWPGATHWPDFLASPNVTSWWTTQLSRMYDTVPFDGIWIDMNEASNFCTAAVCRQASSKPPSAASPGQLPPAEAPGVSTAAAQVATSASEMNDDCPLQCEQPPPDDLLAWPPYAINKLNSKAALGHRTIDMRATHQGGALEYDAHNLYGLAEAKVTAAAVEEVTGKRAFVLSRSTFPGSGRYTGHWTGDNAATWNDLRWSIPGVLNSNLWGIPLAGADICGFQGDTNEELCARWISAGAFYPFSRDHTAINTLPQELYRWPAVAAAARTALGLRYSLLPYLYTAHYLAATGGGTVARPLLWVDPADATARDVWLQWMLGEGLLISPVLQQGATSVSAYFPAGSWYSIWDHSRLNGPLTAELAAPLGEVPVHVRGGTILPRQQAAATSAAVRRSEVELLVALGPPAAAAGSQAPCAGFDQCNQLLEAAVQLATPGAQQQEAVHSPVQDSWWQQLARLLFYTKPLALTDGSSGRAGPHARWTKPQQQQKMGQQQEDGMVACGALYLDDGVSLQLGGGNTLEAWFAAAASADGLSGGLVVQGEEALIASAATGSGGGGAGRASGAAEQLPGVSQVTLFGVGLGSQSATGLAVPQRSSSPAAAGGPQANTAVAHVEVDGIQLPDDLVTYDLDTQTLQVVLPETQAWSWRLTWSVQQQQPLLLQRVV